RRLLRRLPQRGRLLPRRARRGGRRRQLGRPGGDLLRRLRAAGDDPLPRREPREEHVALPDRHPRGHPEHRRPPPRRGGRRPRGRLARADHGPRHADGRDGRRLPGRDVRLHRRPAADRLAARRDRPRPARVRPGRRRGPARERAPALAARPRPLPARDQHARRLRRRRRAQRVDEARRLRRRRGFDGRPLRARVPGSRRMTTVEVLERPDRLAIGDELFTEGRPLERFSVVVTGRIEWSRCINGVDVILSQREGPTYAGASNVLTGDPPVASGRAVTEVDLLTWDIPTFKSFLRDAPTAMRTTVRLIAPIAQAADALVRQQEKLAALGTLSAGLAHELNNPAAAARRTASELGEALATLQDTVHHFVSSGVEREEAARLVTLQQAALVRAGEGEGDVAAADREDRLAELLDDIGQEGWRLAEPLSRACLDEDWLEQVQTAAGPATGAALEWVAASLTAHTLVGELHESTARISELVAAIKDYTHMDRAAVEDVDVHAGLDSTLTMLKYRIKHEPVKVERVYDRSLPPVTVHGSELNQVWTNLLTNALDAFDGGGGEITITTRGVGEDVVVEIADDGPGIPADVQPRIFDPFYTTKQVGDGTGLGLDIARRIVVGHRGAMSVRSRPGETVFSVSIPAAGKGG